MPTDDKSAKSLQGLIQSGERYELTAHNPTETHPGQCHRLDDTCQRHCQPFLGGIGLSLTVLVTIIGIVCIPFAILPTILGVFEIIYAAKLLSNPPQAVQPSTNIAILEIVCILAGNIFSVVVGILALVFYNDLTVKDYFARLNGTIPTEAPIAPVAPVIPASAPASEPVREDEPAPVMPEETAPPQEPPAPDEEAPQS
jgi:hypothetical protein